MDFNEVIRERYSCKRFSNKLLAKEKLQAILEAGRLAPTAKNLQEQHIYIAQSEKALEIIDSVTPCRYQAPCVLVVAYDQSHVFTYPGQRYQSGAEDTVIVATHMMLAAQNAGVDSCWINNFDPDVLKERLQLPENEKIVMLLDLGYADEGAGPLPNHSKRKSLEETVTCI